MRILDTLEYARRLQEAGVAREQAEAHATVLTEMILAEVATKQDVELSIERAVAPLAREIELLRDEIGRMQDRMTIRLGAMLVIGIGALTALQKLT